MLMNSYFLFCLFLRFIFSICSVVFCFLGWASFAMCVHVFLIIHTCLFILLLQSPAQCCSLFPFLSLFSSATFPASLQILHPHVSAFPLKIYASDLGDRILAFWYKRNCVLDLTGGR